MTTESPRTPRRRRPRRRAAAKSGSPRVNSVKPAATDTAGDGTSAEAVARAPYVAVAIQASGIHPRTARMVAIGIATFDSAGTIVDTWHTTLTTGEDPGPLHLHGLTPQILLNSPKFGTVLTRVSELLDDRVLVTHNAPMVWGFVVEEARKARRQANRANRNRRGRNRRPRVRVGKIPTPTHVVDTLETARRHDIELRDTRLRGVAQTFNLECASPIASCDNADIPERVRTLDDVETTIALFKAQGGLDAGLATSVSADPRISCYPIDQLEPDRVGLQRSVTRIGAIDAPAAAENPGKYSPGGALAAGMEFAIAPEVQVNPDELIAAGIAAQLTYSEKVTRQTSIVVCNQPANVTPEMLTGKAMHAHRKDIPLVSDQAFLRLTDQARKILSHE